MAYPSRPRYHRGSVPTIPVTICCRMRICQIQRSSLLTRAMMRMQSERMLRAREVLPLFLEDQIARNSPFSTLSSMHCAIRPSAASTNSRMPGDWQPDMTKQQKAIWASFTSYQQGFGSNSLSTEPSTPQAPLY